MGEDGEFVEVGCEGGEEGAEVRDGGVVEG